MKRVVCIFAVVAAIVLSGFMGVVRAEAWTWGENNHGQLGDGTITNRTAPVQAGGLSGAISASGGGFHTATVKSDGTVWSWGYNNKGQIGNGTITVNELSPVQATGLTGVVSVSAGYEHTVALKSDGTVWAWGYNNYGQLGDGTINGPVFARAGVRADRRYRHFRRVLSYGRPEVRRHGLGLGI